MNDQSASPVTPATRRTVLQCAALAGTAGLALTACSSGSPGSGGSTGSTGPRGPLDLGAASEIPVGGAKVFGDDQVIVTQPTQGTFKAFSAICSHAGCTVAGVTQGVIVCPCHGSEYNPTTGAVVRGPAPSGLPAVAVKVQGGKLLVGS